MRIILKNLNAPRLLEQFYENQRFITVLTTAGQASISWDRWIKSIKPLHISLRSILITSHPLRQDLPSSVLPLVLPHQKSVRTSYPPHRCPLPPPSNPPPPPLFEHKIIYGENYKSVLSLLRITKSWICGQNKDFFQPWDTGPLFYL